MIAHEEIQALKTARMWPKQRVTFWILLAWEKASATANAGQPEKAKKTYYITFWVCEPQTQPHYFNPLHDLLISRLNDQSSKIAISEGLISHD
jgi:hypothetical protein